MIYFDWHGRKRVLKELGVDGIGLNSMGREVKDNKKMDFRSYRSGVRKFVKGIENAVIELSKVSKTLVGDSEIEKTQKRFLLEEKKREL